MRDGSDRSNVPYTRATTLLPPQRPPLLVYLDVKDWIALAKARSGHADGGAFREVLNACAVARRSGVAAFPISGSTYMELSGNRRHRQRRSIGEVIEELSGFTAVASRVVIAQHEVEAMLDALVGPRPEPLSETRYLGRGVAHAFGRSSSLRFQSPHGRDVTSDARSTYPGGPAAFDARLAALDLMMQRQIVDGPTPEDEPALRELGWDPRAARRVASQRAAQEAELAAILSADPRWRRGRIRDVVSAREMAGEVLEIICEGLTQRGLNLTDLTGSRESARQFMDGMPSSDVAVTMKTEYHRDGAHRWTPNDMHDIDVLGSTLPYCDVVVTDKAAASHAVRSGLADRLGTVVLRRLADLPQHLAAS